MWPTAPLTTTDGEPLEIIDTGLQNHNSGPDFFNAKIKIGGTLWVGNVEIHDRSSDWFRHGHDSDAAYDNVVLHVTGKADTDVTTSAGQRLPQMLLEVPAGVKHNYEALLHTDKYPPCYSIIPQLSPLTVHSWMAALQTERLQQKTEAIERRAQRMGGSWEDAYFMTLARNYGFGINGEAFEEWAAHVPLHMVDHHRDNLFQVESLFLGQAGLLDILSVPERYRQQALSDDYFLKLQKEYKYLAHKFQLQPMDYKLWRFLRLRPQNFPHIRLSQLATLYHERRAGLSQLTECTDAIAMCQLMQSHVTPYWESHYTFGSDSLRTSKKLSPASLRLIIINTCIPMLFAYGRHTMKEELCDRAFTLLEQLGAEQNHIIRLWQECGLSVATAGDSQALIQLKREYCDKRDCLRCRIGYEYMKHQ